MFSINHKNTSPHLLNKAAGIQTIQVSPMMVFRRRGINNQSNNNQRNTNQVNINTVKTYSPSDGDKMKWGKHIWTFFHVLAEKVKPEMFSSVQTGLLDLIYSVCNSLPCPVCTEHATRYMKGINFNTIKTRDDLILMLYNFHNSVNARKNFKPFEYADLKKVYSPMNTIAVFNQFINVYKDRQRSIKLLADDLHRSRMSVKIIHWLKTNMQAFNP